MTPKLLLFPAIFAVIALLIFFVDAQEADDDPYDPILCSQDESTRQSVLECMFLMPSVHVEVIKECDKRIAEVEGHEHEKMLDIYCSDDVDENDEEIEACIMEAFQTRGVNENELAKPVIDCFKELVTKS